MSTPYDQAPPSLFDRLPERIFSPLASGNRQQYWKLLRALYERRFGPDAPPVPGEGFARSVLSRDIQDWLAGTDAWEAEEGEEPATPIDVRAQMVLNRLIEAGWLRVDRYGVDKRLSMSPAVRHFLTLLTDFAESEPVYLSGKVRSILANVEAVLAGGHGDQLEEAAKQTRYLLEHVRNTGTNVRDVMDRLTPELTTREFVRQFFSEFVSRIFIGDYRELRTTEHPLAKRGVILAAVERIHDTPELHERILGWYREHRGGGDMAKAAARLRRDYERLRDLLLIDDYLARLDQEVSRANKRALAFLEYRIRSERPLDGLIERAVAATIKANGELRAPFPAGPLVGEDQLRMPRTRTERRQASTLRRTPPSDEQIARSRLMQRMQDARDLDPQRMASFVAQQCGSSNAVSSAALTPDEPFKLFAYQRFIDLAHINSTGSARLRSLARLDLPGYEVQWSDEEPEPSGRPELLGAPPFIVRRRELPGDPK